MNKLKKSSNGKPAPKKADSNKGEVLGKYKLRYEDLKKKSKRSKKNKQTKNSVAKRRHSGFNVLIGRLRTAFKNIYSYFNSVVKKVTIRSKNPKRRTKAEKEALKQQRNNAILGIGQLLVVMSVAYSTTVILIGVDSLISKIVLIPQAVLAIAILIKAFSKLYK